MILWKSLFQRVLNFQLKIGNRFKISLITIFLVSIVSSLTVGFIVSVEGDSANTFRNRYYDYLEENRELKGIISGYVRKTSLLERSVKSLTSDIITLEEELNLIYLESINEYR